MARTDYYHAPDAPKANSVVPSVVAYIEDPDGRVLMIRRSDNGRWALPGGGHDPGESISDTVVRETREETGIVVEVGDLTGIYTDPGHVLAYTDGEVRQQFSMCFRAHVVGGELSTSSETTAVEWIPGNDLATLDVHPTMRLRIAHAQAFSGGRPYIG